MADYIHITDKSHLLQMRGLKHKGTDRAKGRLASHLLQMRGLKPSLKNCLRRRNLVASFTDAWIETFWHLNRIFEDKSHLLQMRGLKH